MTRPGQFTPTHRLVIRCRDGREIIEFVTKTKRGYRTRGDVLAGAPAQYQYDEFGDLMNHGMFLPDYSVTRIK